MTAAGYVVVVRGSPSSHPPWEEMQANAAHCRAAKLIAFARGPCAAAAAIASFTAARRAAAATSPGESGGCNIPPATSPLGDRGECITRTAASPRGESGGCSTTTTATTPLRNSGGCNITTATSPRGESGGCGIMPRGTAPAHARATGAAAPPFPLLDEPPPSASGLLGGRLALLLPLAFLPLLLLLLLLRRRRALATCPPPARSLPPRPRLPPPPLPLLQPSLARASGGGASWRGCSRGLSRRRGFLLCALILVAAGGARPAEAFTCPAGCTCGSASSDCNSDAVSYGGAAATCAACRGMSVMPTLTSDTSVLFLTDSASLAPVINATGFRFPGSWSKLKAL